MLRSRKNVGRLPSKPPRFVSSANVESDGLTHCQCGNASSPPAWFPSHFPYPSKGTLTALLAVPHGTGASATSHSVF